MDFNRLVFYEKVKTSQVYLRDCSQVYPMSLVLMGGQVKVLRERGVITGEPLVCFGITKFISPFSS